MELTKCCGDNVHKLNKLHHGCRSSDADKWHDPTKPRNKANPFTAHLTAHAGHSSQRLYRVSCPSAATVGCTRCAKFCSCGRMSAVAPLLQQGPVIEKGQDILPSCKRKRITGTFLMADPAPAWYYAGWQHAERQLLQLSRLSSWHGAPQIIRRGPVHTDTVNPMTALITALKHPLRSWFRPFCDVTAEHCLRSTAATGYV